MMTFVQNNPWLVVAVLVAILFAFLALVQTLRLARPSRRQRRRMVRAQAGEAEAARLLEAAGYEVESAQVTMPWPVRGDDELLEIALRCDYLVTKNQLRFVAEVKTGQSAPSLQSAGTRRQLLEYLLAYDVDGVLLVDMEAQRIIEVTFPALDL